MLHTHGKQLKSCWDSHILNHTVPVQVSLETVYLTSNRRFVLLESGKREIVPQKNVPYVRSQSCDRCLQPDRLPSYRTWLKCSFSHDMSLVLRKPAFCICENKDADQLRGNREADQRLCFRYTDSNFPLLP